MATYITQNDTGEITAHADWQFPESIQVDFDVVRGYDGKLYMAGGEPTEPSPTLEDQLAAIEAEYEQKQAELDKALVAALRMGGAQEAAARAAIKQKSLKLIQDQNDEIDALSAQQNGG